MGREVVLVGGWVEKCPGGWVGREVLLVGGGREVLLVGGWEGGREVLLVGGWEGG